MNLTPNMRAALEAAKRQALQRRHDNTPGRPAWPANPNTLHALVRHQLLAYVTRTSRNGHHLELWEITANGLQALEPKPVQPSPDRPVFLAAHRGTTHNPKRSMDQDVHPVTGQVMAVETIDPDLLDPHWVIDAEHRHRGSRTPHQRARQLRRAA